PHTRAVQQATVRAIWVLLASGGEPPAGGAGGEVLFPPGKRVLQAQGQEAPNVWRTDIVLGLINIQDVLELCRIGDGIHGPFQDYRIIAAFQVDDEPGISLEVARLAGDWVGAEVERAIQPEAPDGGS